MIRVIDIDAGTKSVGRNEDGELVIHREDRIYVISDLAERIIGHSHITKFIDSLTDDDCSKILAAGDVRSMLLKITQGIPL
ncbi:hypothetical protein LCGC14_1712220 [marine sediment metagenome]|uniref:Uncharacterized protein n=1 Tax=marine sediment metagenome TaxID=412755 RepID=A0A0F9JVB0_9ZZZZ